jgi:hypothetical protein
VPKSGRTTTEEGYGWAHQQARAAMLDRLRRDGVGQCPRCLRPIYPHQARILDAGHSGNRKALGLPPDQLEHRRCNRRAGAIEGNARRRARRTPGATPRPTPGTPGRPPLPEW